MPRRTVPLSSVALEGSQRMVGRGARSPAPAVCLQNVTSTSCAPAKAIPNLGYSGCTSNCCRVNALHGNVCCRGGCLKVPFILYKHISRRHANILASKFLVGKEAGCTGTLRLPRAGSSRAVGAESKAPRISQGNGRGSDGKTQGKVLKYLCETVKKLHVVCLLPHFRAGGYASRV